MSYIIMTVHDSVKRGKLWHGWMPCLGLARAKNSLATRRKMPGVEQRMPLYSACLLMVQDADEPKANAANDKSPDKKPRASKKATGKCSASFCARLGFCLWCSQVVCALPASSVMNQIMTMPAGKLAAKHADVCFYSLHVKHRSLGPCSPLCRCLEIVLHVLYDQHKPSPAQQDVKLSYTSSGHTQSAAIAV